MRRTKKVFTDYNEYHDRPFGLKWGTAFAMAELVQGIEKNEAFALRETILMPQMDFEEIDQVLRQAFLYHQKVLIQLNLRDGFGRIQPAFEGTFRGETYDDYFIIDEQFIFWEDVRHIEVLKPKKWYASAFESKKDQRMIQPSQPQKNTELTPVKNEFYQEFIDESSELNENYRQTL
jgi:hypothetical protein